MAEQKAKEIAAMPIEIVPARPAPDPSGRDFQGRRKMSYADCFGAALARIKNAEFVTGDPEFKEVEKEIKINWLK